MSMTIAKAVEALTVSAEMGDCDSEAVRTLREALELRESRDERRRWRTQVLERLRVMRVGPADVLVLRLPASIIADEEQMRQVKAAGRDIAEVAQRGVVLLEEGTPLGPEHMPQPKPAIHVPGQLPLHLRQRRP